MVQEELRIAVIEPVGGHGGMGYYDYGLCGSLASAGVDVVLHTCDETIISGHIRFDVRHSFSGIYGKAAVWKRGLRYVSGVVSALSSAVLEKRKVIHLHFFHVGVLALMTVVLARLAFRKVVITAHDVESFVSSLEVPFMSRVAYHMAHSVIAHNRISRDELMARLMVPENKIAMIPHGNYLHVLRPIPAVDVARAKLGIPLQAKVLLFFGQIKEVKGLDILLDAMPSVLRVLPNVVLLIAGKPWKTDFSEYQAKIEALGINTACITHIRYIQDEDIAMYYGSADLVVLPYRRIYQSGVVLMAMSYKKAVLVSDLPGMLEVVQDNETGFVFRNGDTVDLIRKIVTILADNQNVASVAENGLRLMGEKYNWTIIGQQTKAVYAGLGRA